jgi:peptide/nickel transport system permease protein
MKAASLMLTVLMVLTIIFMNFMVIPGDPSIFVRPMGSEEDYYRIVDEMRLHDPVFVQYIDYIRDSLVGDFRVSTSFQRGLEVNDIIWRATSPTILLFATAIAISIFLALALEYLASSARNRVGPMTVHILSVVALSAPAMWYSLWLLIMSNDAGLDLPFRGNGFDAVSEDGILGIPTVLEHLFLPLVASVLATFGLFVLGFRWADRRVKMRAAQPAATGFAKWCVSVFRELTGMRPFVYLMVAWTFCVILAVDRIFTYAGLGTLLWNGLYTIDIPLMMAVMFVASLFVLAMGIVLNTLFNLMSRRSLSVALSDWVQRDEALEGRTTIGGHRAVTFPQWVRSTIGRCARSWAFMVAAIALLAVVALGALAPVLATVPDPQLMTSTEPSRFADDWLNPLPPSLEPSPYTGYVHPLGTDPIGRDIYSMMLYGARPTMIIVAILLVGAVLIGFAAGAISFYIPDPDMFPKVLRDLFDFAATTLARTYVVIPLIVLGFAWTMMTEQSQLTVIPLIFAAVYSWGWIVVCRPVRAMKRALGKTAEFGRAFPGILAESLAIAKFVVPIAFLVEIVVSEGTRSPTENLTWYEMMNQIYNYGGYFADYWHLLYVPVSGIVLVCAALFVVLDRGEHILRTSDVFPDGRIGTATENPQSG